MDAGVLKTSGLGWYLRTTDASFVASDEDWVRLRIRAAESDFVQPCPNRVLCAGHSFGKRHDRHGSLPQRQAGGAGVTGRTGAPRPRTSMAWRAHDSAESRITQNANNIAFKVSTSLYNTEKVYRSNTAPTTPLHQHALAGYVPFSAHPQAVYGLGLDGRGRAGAQDQRDLHWSNNVAITTENFLLQLLDPANNENVLMEMSATAMWVSGNCTRMRSSPTPWPRRMPAQPR